MTRNLALLASAFIIGVFAQSPELEHSQLKFENDVVAVYELDLPTHASAPALQSAHDTFWLSLTDATVNFSSTRGKLDVAFQTGDIRFFPSFETKLLMNRGATEFRSVMIVIKPHGLLSSGCECSGNTGKSICGCKGGGHLESLWAVNLGEVTLAGTLLPASESFRTASSRDDMLLVAVTDLKLVDIANGNEDMDLLMLPMVRLKTGDAAWIKAGRHQFKNLGTDSARFVTLEF
jgi:hypothetical protein